MTRKLSTIEHMIEGNITYVLDLDGELALERLRSALDRVQRKHPALRTLIRDQGGELYYEEDCAPEVPLRMLDTATALDVARECHAEQLAPFVYEQPQLRLVWLRDGRRHVLLITTSHRICDGMSILTIVRELLRGLYADDALLPYAPITVQDIIGSFDDGQRWKRRLLAHMVNGLFRLLPVSRRAPDNRELRLEWNLGAAALNALKQRCKTERVSMHAAMASALTEAFAVLGKKAPEWLESPMDARRGRQGLLKEDMLFFGGGNLKLKAELAPSEDFWSQVRTMHQEVRRKIDEELEGIPARFETCEMIRPPSPGLMRSVVRLGDMLSRNGSWNRFSFSNLGNLDFDDADAPFQVKDLSIHVHSFATRLQGIIAYALHGRMRFIFINDEKCLSREEAEALRDAFMERLEQHIGMSSARDEAQMAAGETLVH